MGRKKISITRLTDERNRQITFSKRKAGLLKKAYELSILCDVEIAVIMIASNNKLYQYASSNMNSILIRYTDFKDPDENKTNADILDDITKKERGGTGQDDSGDEEPPAQNFIITPRTQENFRRIDKEFDHLLRTNQVPPSHPHNAHGHSAAVSSSSKLSLSAFFIIGSSLHFLIDPLGSAPPNVPSVMPVTVPVGYSPNTVQQQIQQHLHNQMESQKSGSVSAQLSSASASTGSLFSPASDLSSASPLAAGRGHRSPTNMPPPLATPTRLQTLRNQTLKLHLPGSGRNYISLPTGSGSQSASAEGVSTKKPDGGEREEGEGEESRDSTDGGGAQRPGAKPQLRVFIPGQKEFVPKNQEPGTSPAANLAANPGGGGGVASSTAHTVSTAPQGSTTTTTTDSLTTPVLSLTTPNIFSSLPPFLSGLIGDFPFNQPSAAAVSTGGGPGVVGAAGGGDSSSAALVAFPVSIQPSASGAGGGGAGGNLILQAQNMGQPFLLTPTYDSRQNPLFNSPQHGTFTPPTSSLAAGLSPNIGGLQNLEQLKQQYERTQQMIQQQLLYTQIQMLQQNNQQGKEGGGAEDKGGATATSTSAATTSSSTASLSPHHIRGADVTQETADSVLRVQGSSEGATGGLPQYINGSDVMMGVPGQSGGVAASGSRAWSGHGAGGNRGREGGEDGGGPAKKAKLDSSTAPIQ